LSGEPLMLCSHAGTRTSRSDALTGALSAAGEVLSTWLREGRFHLELTNVHAYALACKLAGDDHPVAPFEIYVS
jgi:hypothetical protein